MMTPSQQLRGAGIAGIVGAVAWTVGDALLVGNQALPQDYPLLFEQYANRIDVEPASVTIGGSGARLAADALLRALTIPLYLIACRHLYLTPAAVIVAVLLDNMPLPQPLRAWLAGAGINVAWLLIFTLSTMLLWNRRSP